MSFSCVKHPMTMGEYICGECGHQFCPECVVFPFGASKPPTCIACALELGGVRRQRTGRPKLTRKAIRQRLAEQRALQDANAAALAEAAAIEQGAASRHEQDPSWLDGSVEAEELPGGWKQTFH
ncbi:MAG: hypothetical protein M3Y51_11570 [Actinomycetota bacterium]|nr:hypothetical protein [Actinomycetota bacterium]